MENVEHFFSYAEQVFSSANIGELYIKIIQNKYLWCSCSNVFIPIRFYNTIALDIDFEGWNSLGTERSNTHYLFSFLLFQCQAKEFSFVVPMYTFNFMGNEYLFALIFNFQEKKRFAKEIFSIALYV